MKSSSPEKKVVDHRCETDDETSKPVDENKKPTSKMSVVWPPQTDSPKKSFTIEEDLKLVKPSWPPKEESDHVNQPTTPSLNEKDFPVVTVQNGPQENNKVEEKEKRHEVSPAERETPASPAAAEESAAAARSRETEESNRGSESGAQVASEMDSEVQLGVGEKEQSGEDGGAGGGMKVEKSEEKSGDGMEEVRVNGHNGRRESAGLEEGAKGSDGGVKNGEAVKVTLIDEEAANANSNNNNNNSNGRLDQEILFHGLNETLLSTDFPQESNWMPIEVLQLAQRDDAFVPASAKRPEATHSDTNLFQDTAHAEPKSSASTFLEDIFAGLSAGSSDLLSGFQSDFFGQPAGQTPPVLALDDLLDFGMGVRESKEEERFATSLWAEDGDTLTVEEQIKRNRYYDDSDN